MEMDQQLKERLVGATVLIVVGIIVIPLLLDGPQSAREVRVGLELPAAQSERETHTIRLDVPASQPASQASGAIERAPPKRLEKSRPSGSGPGQSPPAPVTAADAAPQPQSRPPPSESKPSEPPPQASVATAKTTQRAASSEPATQPAPEEAAAAAPRSADGGWAVQVGSFSQTDNAQRISRELEAAGFDAFSTQIVSRGRTLHRVRVGPVADRSAAEALAGRLEAAGFSGRVVSNAD